MGNRVVFGSGLGDDDVGGVPTDTGDGADQVAEAAKGFNHHLDSVGELLMAAVCWSIKSRCIRVRNA